MAFRVLMRTNPAGITPEQLRASIERVSGSVFASGVCGAEGAAEFFDRKEGRGSGVSVANIAYAHEFGLSPRTPERPFMQTTMAQQRQNMRGHSVAIGQGILNGQGRDQLREAAEFFAEAVQALILGGADLEALSARTMADPERDQRMIPLLDTMQIYDSIQAEEV